MYFLFLFLVVLKNFFTNPNVIENVKPPLAAIIPAGAPITLENDAIEIPPDNIFNDLSKYSKEGIYFLRFLLISSLSLISAKK